MCNQHLSPGFRHLPGVFAQPKDLRELCNSFSQQRREHHSLVDASSTSIQNLRNPGAPEGAERFKNIDSHFSLDQGCPS
eukprot:5534374-Amphidinium_carterae.1